MKYTTVHANASSSTLFWPRKIKLRILHDIYLYTFPKKNFGVARMTSIFVTRCAGNKALFSFGLRDNIFVYFLNICIRNSYDSYFIVFRTSLFADASVVIWLALRRSWLSLIYPPVAEDSFSWPICWLRFRRGVVTCFFKSEKPLNFDPDHS